MPLHWPGPRCAGGEIAGSAIGLACRHVRRLRRCLRARAALTGVHFSLHGGLNGTSVDSLHLDNRVLPPTEANLGGNGAFPIDPTDGSHAETTPDSPVQPEYPVSSDLDFSHLHSRS